MASLAMGLFSLSAFQLMKHIVPGQGTLALAANLGVAILTGIASILPLLHTFGVREAGDILVLMRRRFLESSS